MRWRDFGSLEKVLVVLLGAWWLFGAWAAAALGFRDPWLIVGAPIALGFVLMGALSLMVWLLRRLGL